MSLTAKQKKLIIKIDNVTNRILSNGGNEVELLTTLTDVMDDLKKIIDITVATNELDIYYQKYDGFCHFMKVLEELATGIADGSFPVPKLPWEI